MPDPRPLSGATGPSAGQAGRARPPASWSWLSSLKLLKRLVLTLAPEQGLEYRGVGNMSSNYKMKSKQPPDRSLLTVGLTPKAMHKTSTGSVFCSVLATVLKVFMN